MDLGIIVPVIALLIIVPTVYVWANRRFKDATVMPGDSAISAPSVRLTSNALRELPAPPWRIVYEIADDKLGGIDHVVIGPPGIYALLTTIDPLPDPPGGEPDARTVARSAIRRGRLDDALQRSALSSDSLVRVHWGRRDDGASRDVVLAPGDIAVDGRSLPTWMIGREGEVLSPAQIDLAWQAVLTTIGRPDPLE